jgi:hypothetical protein
MAAGGIALPLVRIEASAKCAKGVGLIDVAAYLEQRLEAAREECSQLCGWPETTTAQQPVRSLRRWIGLLRGHRSH